MFNRTIVQAARGPSTIIKHEHRAPTDESVRILDDLQRRAEERVTDAIRIEGNGFNTVIQIYTEARHASATAKCVFDINGKRIAFEETCHVDEFADDRNALLRKVMKTAAERVAAEIVIPAFAAQIRNITI